MPTTTFTEPPRPTTWDATKGRAAQQVVNLKVSNDLFSEVRFVYFDFVNFPEVVGGATLVSGVTTADRPGLTISSDFFVGSKATITVFLNSPGTIMAPMAWTLSCRCLLSTGAYVVATGRLVFSPATNWGGKQVINMRVSNDPLSEVRTLFFDFADFPELGVGDSIDGSYSVAADQPGLTIGTPSLVQTTKIKFTVQVTAPASILAPTPWTLSCKVDTVAGLILVATGKLVFSPATAT